MDDHKRNDLSSIIRYDLNIYMHTFLFTNDKITPVFR